MNLIRNTLLIVTALQLLGFLYIKLIHEKSSKHTLPVSTIEIASSNKITIIDNNYLNRVINSSINDVLKESKEKKHPPMKKPLQKKIKLETYSLNKKVENYAKEFLGKKYVWGATGPTNFDCSGFTQKVYKNAVGIFIPRVSREQAKVGKYIEYSELKQGDMVFFDTSKEHKGIVNHVGIYLNNGEFIHASSGGKRVMITNFNKKKFYKNRFLWGRRVLRNNNNLATLHQKEQRGNS